MIWRPLPEERVVLYSPAWIRVVDAFDRRQPPQERLQIALDLREGDKWWPTGIAATITPSGVISYPGLGRHRDPANAPERIYRVRVDANGYRPQYPHGNAGVEFTTYPYDDEHPPSQAAERQDLMLVPSAAYPFPSLVPVLRGTVVSDLDAPVEGATVEAKVTGRPTETTLSDRRGVYGLPLRWAERDTTVTVQAAHPTTGQAGEIEITLPGALFSHNHRIVIPSA